MSRHDLVSLSYLQHLSINGFAVYVDGKPRPLADLLNMESRLFTKLAADIRSIRVTSIRVLTEEEKAEYQNFYHK